MKDFTVSLKSKIGKILIKFENKKIKKIELSSLQSFSKFEVEGKISKKFFKIIKEFENYLSGKSEDFENSKKLIDYRILSDFQKRVFEELLKVKWGTKITYSELAKRIGGENFKRAVGRCLNKNPFPIVIPCHRVVGKNGISGFSHGTQWKKRLLELEGISI
ncbi:MAG: methylated-DNA--[protein]-cysteine S-methyltransferase [Candidatus Hydrothermales bacterium]